jgi:hypothetical protein
VNEDCGTWPELSEDLAKYRSPWAKYSSAVRYHSRDVMEDRQELAEVRGAGPKVL